MEPLFIDSARKRGISEENMRHAIDNATDFFAQDDGMDMYIGPAFDGSLLEVGVLVADNGQMVVAHAMKARSKYIRRNKPPRR